jgi:chromosome segregation ATPase
MTKAELDSKLALSEMARTGLEAELEEAQAELSQLSDDYISLAHRCEDAIGAGENLTARANALWRENQEQARQIAQLQSNLSTFRDRFKARVSEMSMEARFWQLDIAELLAK